MEKFCDEIWFCITSFADVKGFAQFWLSCPKLFRNEHIRTAAFWNMLLRYICRLQNRNFELITASIGASHSGLETLRNLFCPRKCTRSGCYRSYTEWDNTTANCSYHPGKIRAMGYLSCCRGKGFQSPGCRRERHSCGVLLLVHMARRTELPDGEAAEVPTSALPAIRSASVRGSTTALPPTAAASVRDARDALPSISK
jgi:hypothetical protein